ncbi:NOC3p-domain-containing protein [Punctularia strigosozonata HHB-11173 SS5]|uniref:NOC3p-domain-containing protein n=1 Tax=Punctularia strigosozonata (strain HHB-11173) TaxID=741275 RepID=UPI0004418024|nr:NOC3p-domain-containing protein [Punctularia strigosozonata HHB-11173 SS5]EIN07402.1 NOC3p-domain-containing protein [Punctularia strigosozonata HHB-11173 SS5]
MAINAGKKRTAKQNSVPSKKVRLAAGPSKSGGKTAAKNIKAKAKGKERAADKKTIPIPEAGDEDEIELSDEDLDMLEEFGDAAGFLGHLDKAGIARSKKETERLHGLVKPVRIARRDDDLPSINSHTDDESDWSGLEEQLSDSGSEDEEPSVESGEGEDLDSDAEMPYETKPRLWRTARETSPKNVIDRLPIKLADGRIAQGGTRVIPGTVSSDESEEESEEEEPAQLEPRREDVSTGARFGRPAVVDVILQPSRKARIQGAKEQIAALCQEILADPENSLGLLRRLHTFSLTEISTPSHPEPVPNDPTIRKLAILSQTAVFRDVIPGYRIRSLTDKEKAEKVSQMVARTRDWEQGLVGVYQHYLKSLEAEIKAKSELADLALQCMCKLLVEVTHFNFRANLLSTVVARLSRRSWDKTSDLCLDTLIKVFRVDAAGQVSLEAIRLINRMVKERHFAVHPNVLRCLLHLRLKQELGVRASQTKADKHPDGVLSAGRAAQRRSKGKAAEQPHLSKKARKALKEKKEIEKELHEASAEVDKEERANNQTETLKLLFVLYFRILKSPRPTPLLPAALQGIARFAHLVNVDFFKDLLNVLKELVSRDDRGAPAENGAEAEVEAPADADAAPSSSAAPGHGQPPDEQTRHRLRCIIAAFELLSGQGESYRFTESPKSSPSLIRRSIPTLGEALDIDLADFVNSLYGILPTLSFDPSSSSSPYPSPSAASASDSASTSTFDLAFRALDLVFSPRRSLSQAHTPSWRAAAFSKRLLTAALHWPSPFAARAIAFVQTLVARDPKLDALLGTADRAADGVHRPYVDDPQLCNPFGTAFYELLLLRERHCDPAVRKAAVELADFTR